MASHLLETVPAESQDLPHCFHLSSSNASCRVFSMHTKVSFCPALRMHFRVQLLQNMCKCTSPNI
eukprot:857391-Karenia_brevis.AAC.1